jgi:hypothetical protein
MDTMFIQSKVLKDAFNEARKHGAQLLTSHLTKASMMDSEYICVLDSFYRFHCA